MGITRPIFTWEREVMLLPVALLYTGPQPLNDARVYLAACTQRLNHQMPTVPSLAQETDLQEVEVQASVDRLRDAGWVGEAWEIHQVREA